MTRGRPPANTPQHGTTTRYTRGCHCVECRAAGTLQYKRWKLKTTRTGQPLKTDATRARQQLHDLYQTRRWTWQQLSTEIGLTSRHAWTLANRTGNTTLRTANAINQLWQTYCAPIPPDRRRWPTAPFRQHLINTYGSIGGSPNLNQRRRLVYMADTDTIDTETAERWCAPHRWHPTEIWPDWYDTALNQQETA